MFEINSALFRYHEHGLSPHSYHTREYKDYADYDHAVSVVPYAMGPITANVGLDPAIGILLVMA